MAVKEEMYAGLCWKMTEINRFNCYYPLTYKAYILTTFIIVTVVASFASVFRHHHHNESLLFACVRVN